MDEYSVGGKDKGFDGRGHVAPVTQPEEKKDIFILPDEGIDMEEVEKSLLRQALEKKGGNQSAAARLLGISRYALRHRKEKFKL